MPFKAQTVSILKKLILEGDYTLPTYLSFECQNTIKGLLQNEPKDRLTISQLQKCNWLKDQTFPACLPTDKVVLPSIMSSTTVEEKGTSTDERNEQSGELLIASSSSPTTLSTDEKEIVRQLTELGITEKLIKENSDKGLRSNVIGTYRIIIHRVMTTRYDKDGKRRSSSMICNEFAANGDNHLDQDSAHANPHRDKCNNYSQTRRSHKSMSKSIKSIKSIFTGNQCNEGCNYNNCDEYRTHSSWKMKPTTNNYVYSKHRSKRSQKISKACIIL
ncbi:serine/threonine-protein kinase NIM1-like protein [Leptotrombidium deliense]|uniref:Serine/threonine-protein kinase NIM1-like protein n=1 Tax=Leptotrombidium deliense TaxID=299467 RepID=A0A443SGF3_9ACAR|nr:serine/threonine-protein kinase NIM1-like protein [Leptotrombidium deliense]